MKDKELRKLIGSRAKQRRLELNLTQHYVAEKMGAVSYTHLDVYKRQPLRSKIYKQRNFRFSSRPPTDPLYLARHL